MSKKLLEDMVKVNKVANINVAKERISQKESDDFLTRKYEEKLVKEHETITLKKGARSGPKYTLWFVALIAIAFMVFSLSFLFSKASVVVTAKNEEFTINSNFVATKDASNSGGVPFNIVVISDEESKNVNIDGKKEVSQKAKGSVIIYNNFSTSSQNLAIDTRLEGSNGKIYKTTKALVVPGKKPDGTPGSIEVDIYASVAGKEYNSGPLDFKIFGFKGTPKYDKIYARSKGNISGGVVGGVGMISELDKSMAQSELRKTLEEKLLSKAAEQVPEGYILYKDAYNFSTEEVQPDLVSSVAGTQTAVTLKGTFSGILFKESDLTKKIAETLLTYYDDSPVFIPEIKSLKFSFAQNQDLLFDTEKINFNLKGEMKIIWGVDGQKFAESLAGKDKKNFSRILLNYPNISSAELVLRPFWNSVLPKNSKDINVIINY